ncbi:MAG TPA: hypothetical protein VLB49_16690 [Gemmatimonadales bacterium]|nr:hypothetical protein [Gemmatimonadales bacterium]
MRACIPAVALALGACATGSTLRSGVGDRILEHPPFYASAPTAPDTGRIGHFPIGYQRGATQAAQFDPAAGRGTPLAALQEEMSRYLDSILPGNLLLTGTESAPGTPPDVRFSCEADPSGDCIVDTSRALGRGDIRMRLAVGRPSNDWVAWTSARMASAGVATVLVLTLEVGQYRVRQTGLLGKKEIELGTDYVSNLPWLTSVETPVNVLQVTGALMGRDGRALRIGAEGMLARRSGILASAAGLQALITDREVEELRAARRGELPGQPLVWQMALRSLVAGLTGRPLPALTAP